MIALYLTDFSKRGRFDPYNQSTPPLLIKVPPVQSGKSMVMYVCVRGSILSRSTTLIFDFGTVGMFLGGPCDQVDICSNSYSYNQINTTGATSGAETAYHSGAPEFTHDTQWGSCYSIFSFMCMFCRSLFVLLYFFFWPLCCLFFDLRILITLINQDIM